MNEREIQVLYYIGEGLTSEQIAQKLFISKRTVDFYRTNIKVKIGAENVGQIVKFAVENKPQLLLSMCDSNNLLKKQVMTIKQEG